MQEQIKEIILSYCEGAGRHQEFNIEDLDAMTKRIIDTVSEQI